MNIEVLDIEKFKRILSFIDAPSNTNVEFLYNVYENVINGIKEVFSLAENATFTPVNQVVVIAYILNEFIYSVQDFSKEQIDLALNNDEFLAKLVSICADKYLTNEQLNFKSKAFLNRFNPPISSIELYLNFCLNYLNQYKTSNRNTNLIKDMLLKSFALSKCILNLLTNGFETEAFSTWRTLHEQECILLVLIKNGNDIFDAYFEHIKYALAYRKIIKDTDPIFEKIKAEMRDHSLRSKDTKKYIEYGYLYKAKNIDEIELFKLNFRDGVQKVAGLEHYSKFYEMSSEIAHSSPLLLYSNRKYFFKMTILNLYETFFRLEPVFTTIYKTSQSEEEINKYLNLRQTYMQQIYFIYNRNKKIIIKETEQYKSAI